jgi:acyl carrier protein
MKKNKLLNEIKKIFKIIFKINPSKINLKTNYKNVKSWDSLNHVRLIMALESKFKISISPNNAHKLLSFTQINNYISKKKNKL